MTLKPKLPLIYKKIESVTNFLHEGVCKISADEDGSCKFFTDLGPCLDMVASVVKNRKNFHSNFHPIVAFDKRADADSS